ncbi:MAG: DUF937 domain-containing protein [Hyphomonadaceae bacterium]
MAGINMFDMIKGAAGGMIMKQVAQQFGLNGGQAEGAIKALLPAISGGLKRNTGQEGGLQGLMSALQGGNHEQYLDDPAHLGRAETVQDGNAILGHLLGSKDMSRQVATHAAQKTGIDSGILKQMLPMVAAMAMGSLSKQSKQPSVSDALMGALSGGGSSAGGSGLAGMVGSLLGGGKQQAQSQSGGLNLGMLGGLLDADGDGNPMDDILNMVMKR